MKTELSIIIVNFNTTQVLSDCLRSLFSNYERELSDHLYEVIVVDNASADSSVKMISEQFPKVRLLKNSENQGFAKANNTGITYAKSEYILLLNPDTRVPKQTLTKMIKYMGENPQVGIATCKVLLTDGQLDDASHRGFPTPWRALTYFLGLGRLFPHSMFFNGYHLGYRNLDQVHEIESCVGAFLLLRRSVGEAVDWLDEDYFWYGDDLDLCFRVKEHGYKVMFVPEVSITHYKGVASGIKKHSQILSTADKATRLRSTKARFEVMRIFYQKHYQQRYPKWLMSMVFLGIAIKQKLSEATL